MNRRLPVWLLLTVIVFGMYSAVPRSLLSQTEMAPVQGMLLVAREGIADPRFQETVILLIRYDAGGGAGLILNRPTTLPLADALPETKELKGRSDSLFYGGPVEPTLLLVLLRSEHPPSGSAAVTGNVYLTGLPKILDRLDSMGETGENFRTFMGYAGWAPGQLAGEIVRGDWHIEPFDETAVFAEDPATLWRRLRERAKEIWI